MKSQIVKKLPVNINKLGIMSYCLEISEKFNLPIPTVREFEDGFINLFFEVFDDVISFNAAKRKG